MSNLIKWNVDERVMGNAIRKAFPGRDVRGATDVAAALWMAGAGFSVSKKPMMAVLSQDEACPVEGFVALCRSDSGETMGIAAPTYGLVQPADVFAPAQILADAGDFQPSSVQVTRSQVRLSGLIGVSVIERAGATVIDTPDMLGHFATFLADFSGKARNRAELFTLRLRCTNGNTTRDHAAAVSIAHRGNAEQRTRDAYATLFDLKTAALREAADFQLMAEREVGDYRAFATSLLEKVRGECDTEAKSERRAREILELEQLFQRGDGNTGSTLWDAYNSVTDWIDHKRARAGKAYDFAKNFESANYGAGEKAKRIARQMLTRW